MKTFLIFYSAFTLQISSSVVLQPKEMINGQYALPYSLYVAYHEQIDNSGFYYNIEKLNESEIFVKDSI